MTTTLMRSCDLYADPCEVWKILPSKFDEVACYGTYRSSDGKIIKEQISYKSLVYRVMRREREKFKRDAGEA